MMLAPNRAGDNVMGDPQSGAAWAEAHGTTAMARSIARWVREVDATALDAHVVEKAKVCLLDLIGIAAQATDLPWSRQAAEFAEAMGGDEATLVGSPARAGGAEAAFANATTAHGLVQEDMPPPSVSHIGVVVWPTLLALAEHEPDSKRVAGLELIASGSIDYQVMGGLGEALITK